MTRQEFAYLSDRIRGKLLSLARRFSRASGLESDAEDIVQDAMVTLWELSEKGYPIRDPEALAVKITKTRCVERYRRQHIRYEPLADPPAGNSFSAPSGTEEMDIETIRTIVEKDLTEGQRQALSLRRDSGLSLDEIAAATGRPKASVKVSLSTARKKMMEQLKRIK